MSHSRPSSVALASPASPVFSTVSDQRRPRMSLRNKLRRRLAIRIAKSGECSLSNQYSQYQDSWGRAFRELACHHEPIEVRHRSDWVALVRRGLIGWISRCRVFHLGVLAVTCFVRLARLGALSLACRGKSARALLAIGGELSCCAQSLSTDGTVGLG